MRKYLILAVIFLAAIVFAGVVARPDHQAPKATAAPTVSPSVFLSPTGNDSNGCTQALPCKTFQRGLSVAAGGATVELAAGAYGFQQLAAVSGKGTSPITFQPAAGASVSVSTLDFGNSQLGILPPSYVTVKDMAVSFPRVWDGLETGITLQNLTGKWFDVLGGANVRVIGGDYGPCQAPRDDACTPRLTGSNQLVDGVSIHGMVSTDLANYHVDGMFVRGCNTCAVRHTKFWSNQITNIRVQNCCGLPANSALVLEDNWFGTVYNDIGLTSPRFDAVDIDTPVPNLRVSYNSFAEGSGMQDTGGGGLGSGSLVNGNLMGNQVCSSGTTYRNNVYIPFSEFTGQTPCGASDRKVTTFGYVNNAGRDFHITSSSPAVGAGGSDCVGTLDIDGETRTSPCDAGADQRLGTPPPATTTVVTTAPTTTTVPTTTTAPTTTTVPSTTTAPTTTTTPTGCKLDGIWTAKLTDLRASTIYTSTYKNANPAEWARIDAWLNAPSDATPGAVTSYGKSLTDDGILYLRGCGK